MKRFLLFSTMTVLSWTVAAQTNTAETPAADAVSTNAPAASADTMAPTNGIIRAATEITSDSANFDLKTRIAVYIGHVRVTDPQMDLTCGILTARVPESGRIDSIVAERDVLIDGRDQEGKPFHATADKAVYTYKVVGSATNEIIELTCTGTNLATLISAKFKGAGNPITWNRSHDYVSGENVRMFFNEPISRDRTNPPAFKP